MNERCNQEELEDVMKVLREFVTDVESAYGYPGNEDLENFDDLTEKWPDLAVTYLHARQVLSKLSEGR